MRLARRTAERDRALEGLAVENERLRGYLSEIEAAVDKASVARTALLTGWASDELRVEPVARAIYLAGNPVLAETWNRECDEVRLHYFSLASAAIEAVRAMIAGTEAS